MAQPYPAPAPAPKPYSSRGGQALPVTPHTPRHHTGSGQKTNPATGLPVMQSAQEIRAEANAAAWKSIAAMQAALPTPESINAPYDAQRAAIAPLVAAHRSWLEQAGQYQTQMANKLGALAGATVRGADAVQAGQAGAAGMPQGSGFAGNVSPDAIGAPEAYGSNFGSFLSSLLPSATAQGIGNIGLVNTAQDSALRDLSDKRAAIAGQVPKIEDDAYTNAYTNAFNEYKSELAALADAGKTSLDVAKFKETVRYHTGQLGLSEDRNTIASQRADAALKADTRTAGDASGLRAALIQADLYMHPKAGKGSTRQVPTRYGVEYEIPSAGKDPSTGLTVPPQTKFFGAGSLAEVQRQVASWLKANPHAGWQAMGNIKPVKGYTKTVTTPGASASGNAYARRQHAWGILVAANNASLHPMDVASLKALFQRQEGPPH